MEVVQATASVALLPIVAYGNTKVHLPPCKRQRQSATEAWPSSHFRKSLSCRATCPLTHMFKTIGDGLLFRLPTTSPNAYMLSLDGHGRCLIEPSVVASVATLV